MRKFFIAAAACFAVSVATCLGQIRTDTFAQAYPALLAYVQAHGEPCRIDGKEGKQMKLGGAVVKALSWKGYTSIDIDDTQGASLCWYTLYSYGTVFMMGSTSNDAVKGSFNSIMSVVAR